VVGANTIQLPRAGPRRPGRSEVSGRVVERRWDRKPVRLPREVQLERAEQRFRVSAWQWVARGFAAIATLPADHGET